MQKIVNIETTNARAQMSVTDTTPTVPLPDTPQGLMVIGPQVTLHFVEGEWNQANSYDYYDVVQVDGTSYIAVQDVPTNTPITNTEYWAKWNDPNAQVELLQQTVSTFNDRIDANTDSINTINTNLSKYITFVTPEQYGAKGDGNTDDTIALQNAINSGKTVVGNGVYKCTSKIIFNKSYQACFINKIISSADYAVSIFNGTLGQVIFIGHIISDNAGVIAETTSITGKHTVLINYIEASNGPAFNMVGGSGGILDCHLSGRTWNGSTQALVIKPASSFIGNITFDSVRFNGVSANSTALIIDSSTGALTQLHFPNCSIEPETDQQNANGILINVTDDIEYIDGFFRSTELTGKTGYILKISGNVTTQLSQGMDLTFDHIIPSKIDLSELTMNLYYSLENPICNIHCKKTVFATQSQTSEIVIKGNKIRFKPTRKKYALSSGDYNWSNTPQPQTAIEFSGDGKFNLPEWFDPDCDTIFIKPSNHNITVVAENYGTQQQFSPINNNEWMELSFYRDNNNKLYMVAK